MDTTKSDAVHRSPAWGEATRTQSATPHDPMAFFDLIMQSAKATTKSAHGSAEIDAIATTETENSKLDSHAEDEDGSDPGYDPNHHDSGYVVPAERQKEIAQGSGNNNSDSEPAAEAVFSDQGKSQSKQQLQQNEGSSTLPVEVDTRDTLLGNQETEILDSKKTIDLTDVTEPLPNPLKTKTGSEIEDQIVAEQEHGAASNVEVSDSEPVEAYDPLAKSAGKQKESDDLTNQQQATEIAVEGGQEFDAEVARHDRQVDSEKDEQREADIEAQQVENVESAADEGSSETGGDRGSSDPRKSSSPRKQSDTSNQVNAADTQHDSKVSETTTAPVAEVPPSSAPVSAAEIRATLASSSSSNNSSQVSPANQGGISSMLQRGIQKGTLQKTTAPQGETKLDPKQQIRLINRVASAVKSTPPGQPIRIRLNPTELGALKLEIRVENGNMIAKVEAENSGTRQILLDNLPQLRERLAESNIQVERFEIDTMQEEASAEGGLDDLHGQDQGNRQNQGRRVAQSTREDDASESTENRISVNKNAERDSQNLNVTV